MFYNIIEFGHNSTIFQKIKCKYILYRDIYKFYRSKVGVVLYYTLLFFVSIHQGYAQQEVTDLGPEKVYLHTDRSTYFLGEDLWYKAYVVRSNNNLLSNLSNVLYVELVSSTSQIVARNKTNLEMGLGNGDFKLTGDATLEPGFYQLRAYTNWNRNFEEEFVFTKNIQIIDLLQTLSATDKKTEINTKNNYHKRSAYQNVQIDFFPEGGSLLENVTAVIGFKAIDEFGNPIDVKGGIYDSTNTLITNISSEYAGMGKLQLFPIKGEHYYAKITTSLGTEEKKELPKPLAQGYNLGFKKFKGKYVISILTNRETLIENPSQEVRIILSSRGIPYFEIRKKINESVTLLTIPKERLHLGITKITLYDNNSRPYSERLIYVEKGEDIQVGLEMDKVSYKPGEQVQLGISSTLESGKSQSASFSLSVTDINASNSAEENSSNICSYFLLESDLRGKVYKPNYYFDHENVKRLEHLDNLLLTQGWRDFLWKKRINKKDTIVYKAEKGFTFSGRVRRVFNNKALPNSSVSLVLINSLGFKVLNTPTDSLGYYSFKKLVFFGKTNVFLNSTNEKGKARGLLVLDPVENDTMPVLFMHPPTIRELEQRQLVEKVYNKFEGFGVPPENILSTVTITKKKSDDLDIFYGAVDYTYIANENTSNFRDIYTVLAEVPGVIVEDRSVAIAGERSSPLILIDDYANSAGLKFINPDEVVKIEVIRFSEILLPIYGEAARGGIISIFTEGTSRMNKPKKTAVNSIKKEINGFYEAREFYTQSSSTDNVDFSDFNSVRNTIFWSPNIIPIEGKAEVKFDNIEIETTAKITLEGITAGGIPIVKHKFYSIEE